MHSVDAELFISPDKQVMLVRTTLQAAKRSTTFEASATTSDESMPLTPPVSCICLWSPASVPLIGCPSANAHSRRCSSR
jgi:hypothetical protein